MADCIFCEIVAGRAPAHVVCEDERTLVFLDIFPAAEGHVLLIPKAHCENLYDIDPADLRAVADRSHAVAAAIRRALAPDGLGAFQLNGAAAGQTVFHYHLHLVPRREGSPMQLHGRRRGEPAELEGVARRIADALERGPSAPGALEGQTTAPLGATMAPAACRVGRWRPRTSDWCWRRASIASATRGARSRRWPRRRRASCATR